MGAYSKAVPSITYIPPRVTLGHMRIDAVTTSQALERIGALVGKGGGTVFTPNVDHVVRAESDTDFARAYGRCALQLCDGQPVKWATALGGEGVPEKISGSTFLPEVLHRANREHWRVYCVGGRVGAPERGRVLLSERYPQVQLLGWSAPTRTLMAEGEAALDVVHATLVASKPDLVLVSLPSPLQEVWADASHSRTKHGVYVCTGSAIDIMVGLAPRAPARLSGLGLEWAWRVAHEPRRLAMRYARDAVGFVPVLARHVWSLR